jgi:hypothetical protein
MPGLICALRILNFVRGRFIPATYTRFIDLVDHSVGFAKLGALGAVVAVVASDSGRGSVEDNSELWPPSQVKQ